ncbi:MAG: hypothetical protein VX874_12035 [Pseudomonadota bacterium]|nr:hypothetical protein [Pseudomonadota bacterium]
MTLHTPKHFKSPDRLLERATNDRVAPVLYAGGMLALGIALIVAKPRIGNVPKPLARGDESSAGRLRRAAIRGRDGVEAFAPSNVTDSLGRSLILGGAALLVARVLDEVGTRRG